MNVLVVGQRVPRQLVLAEDIAFDETRKCQAPYFIFPNDDHVVLLVAGVLHCVHPRLPCVIDVQQGLTSIMRLSNMSRGQSSR
jgi:hypothetical protein